MNKKIIVLVAAIIVIVLGIVLYFVFQGNPSTTGLGNTGTLPPVVTGTGNSGSNATTSFPSGGTFQIGTNQGSVTVNNFYKTNDYITQDQETIVLVENDNYTIVYNRDDSSFIIALLSVPGALQSAREVAETDFLNQLGVSKGDACKLVVDERVLDQNSSYDGDLMGLSFCTSPSTSAQ